MAEALGRSIYRARENSQVSGIRITSNLDSLTHQQFVDDTMLYGLSNLGEARAFKQILDSYSMASRQEINPAKSEVFFFNTKLSIQKEICGILNFNLANLPCKYLGLPSDKGSGSSNMWDGVVEKIKSRVAILKGKWLSFAGKATLVKSVLVVVPIYQLSCFNLPQSKKEILNRHLRSFFWQGAEEKKRISLMAWDKICRPKSARGIGIKDIKV
ncbi:uncharacterized protein LOC131858288 [Cryptomeria japonica]|uniref:uncharacterized protein LOC131858288 n=1 Tax=Cryptomeria japonica TaxID=3369 RepID=UPI0027DAA12D|nr:uncharacterized protein LOC131858288 [Cryptomeria japonica]